MKDIFSRIERVEKTIEEIKGALRRLDLHVQREHGILQTSLNEISRSVGDVRKDLEGLITTEESSLTAAQGV